MFNQNHVLYKPMNVIGRMIALFVPVVCILLMLTLTAFAKNTYYINDGGRVLVHTTYATDPAEILNEAGVQLDSGDTYTTQSGVGSSEITIQRRQTITVKYQGNVMQLHSYGETVESLLRQLQLQLQSKDVLSYPLDAQTFDGMVLSIGQTLCLQDTYTTAIPFETVYCQDSSLPEGQKVVLIPGREGQLSCVDTVYYVDGKEVSRTEDSRDIVTQPVNALIAIGTQVSQPSQIGTIIAHNGEQLRYYKSMTVKATAYSKYDEGCDDYTATGTLARYGIIAVDPNVIPLGTEVYIVSNDGVFIYGKAVAEDTGGAIKGDRIDLYYDTVEQCMMFGRRECTVYFLIDEN